MTWLSDTEYLCYQCSFCRNRNSVLSSFITYHRVLTAVAQRVPLIEQELEVHVAQSFVFCINVVTVCPFSFGHYMF